MSGCLRKGKSAERKPRVKKRPKEKEGERQAEALQGAKKVEKKRSAGRGLLRICFHD